MQNAIRASFYRGGTSKGLFFRTRDLQPYTPALRDKILLSAMGSPDPDGRQIDGLGGGISSLSKVAVVGMPGEPRWAMAPSKFSDRNANQFAWPDGVSWADDVERAMGHEDGWDVVYRFAQIGVKEPLVDWGSTCGNLVAAVAHFAVDDGLVQKKIQYLLRSSSSRLTIRILAADTGKIVKATLGISPKQHSNEDVMQGCYAHTEGPTRISGVPGTAAPVHIETPLEGNPLPTGKELHVLDFEGEQIPCSIIHAGLPCIFIAASSIIPPDKSPSSMIDPLSLSPADLDADNSLRTRLESIRRMIGTTFASLKPFFSESQPKICIVGPPAPYTSTSGALIPADAVDCRIRAVSVGNFHRTVPATMLSALAVARTIRGTIVERQCRSISNTGGSTSGTSLLFWKRANTIRVGQPAGVSEATATLNDWGQPESILYVRTARCIMTGYVLIPQSIFVRDTV